ncbi:MAG: hypothetical protein ABS79_06770 [Planctomycetes bacterium SCN 63-9]|nr:MAG: hypothetical protein ABS79_06770 [Planctomycetes bacterium SCN 63-9]
MAASIHPVVTPPLDAPEAAPSFSLFDHRRRITVDEYHRIVEAGILGAEPRVELLDGVIVNKMTKNPPHNLACDLIQHLMMSLVGTGHFISMGTSMTVEEYQGEPEPDAMILRGKPRDYTNRRRTPENAPLVIEVSDTSYSEDRSVKWSLYAASGIPVYWILNLKQNQLEIHAEPTGRGEAASYAQRTILGPDDEVPLVLDGREIGRFILREILP